MTATIARWSVAHKRAVIACWLLLTIAGIASIGPATKALSDQFSVPGREGWQTNAASCERSETAATTRRSCRW